MLRKKTTEATIAPSPVVNGTVPAAKKTSVKKAVASGVEKPAKKAAPRKKAVLTPVAASTETSIANLAEAVHAAPAIDIHDIEERAYQSWIERGCPMGSPEEDWFRAERELIARYATAGK